MTEALNWRKPDNVTITPQRMGFKFDRETLPDYWLYDSPFITTWMESLSILFPEGEQFFVDSVRAFRDQIQDKAIQKQISGFIGQEAMHSLEHVALNKYLDEKGLPAAELEGFVRNLLNLGRKIFPKRSQLAITTGLEHITAMLANLLLEDTAYSQEKREQMHEAMRSVWMWHAIEETEHKGVAYDLYQHVGGTYLNRTFYMLLATTLLVLVTNYFHFRMLLASGNLFNFKDILFGIKKLYGRNGYVTKLIPIWLGYFRPGFHPWDDDNSALIERWKRQVMEAADPKYVRNAA